MRPRSAGCSTRWTSCCTRSSSIASAPASASTTGSSGLLLAIPLAASAFGGALFGWIADRRGRVTALRLSILVYSGATAACAFSQSALQLGIARLVLGLGIGGEWATGAALVAETWPAEHRGKALGIMQSAWAIGYGLAAAVNALVLPRFGWRAVFLVGLLPALIVFWIRRHVEEPALWRASRREQNAPADLRDVFLGTRARVTWTVTAMHSATMFAWWGLFSWIPSYLTRPVADGGAGLSLMRSSIWIALMQVGMWLGYVSFGFVADRVGRKPAYVTYVLAAAALVPVYANAGESGLLIVGPCLAFFGTGYFSGFGAVTVGAVPDLGPRDGPGADLQHRPALQRARAVHRRQPRHHTRPERRVPHCRRRVPRRRDVCGSGFPKRAAARCRSGAPLTPGAASFRAPCRARVSLE